MQGTFEARHFVQVEASSGPKMHWVLRMRQQSQAFLAMGLPLRELLLVGVICHLSSVIRATLSTARSEEPQ